MTGSERNGPRQPRGQSTPRGKPTGRSTKPSRPQVAAGSPVPARLEASPCRWPRNWPRKPIAASLDDTNDRYEKIKQGEIHIAELQKMSMSQLIEEARKENVTDVAGMKKQDLIFRILKERVKMNGLMYGEGTLEILPDGFGSCAVPTTTTCPARTTSTFRPARSADSACRPVRPFRADPAAQRKRTLFRPAAGRGDQLSRSQSDGRQGPVRRSDAAAPGLADRDGDRLRKNWPRGWST